jgi:glutaredoxin
MVKKATYFITAILLFSGLFWLLSQPPKNKVNTNNLNSQSEEKDIYKDFPVYDNPDLTFFWGNGCPHCKNVEDWLDKNNTDKKIKINYKEVYYNQENQKTLSETVKQYCPELMQNGGVGVPVGFDPAGKKCIQGDTPIIEFLSAKLK